MNNGPPQVYPMDRTMEATTFNEAQTLIEARNGDRAAFGALVKAYQRRAYAAAYALVHNRDDALELAQDAFVRAYAAMPRFNAELPFYPWLHRIIRNTCINHIKKKRRRGETSLQGMLESGFDVARNEFTPERAAVLDDIRSGIADAMRRLKPEHREILMLRHFHDMSYSDIALCLNVPRGTVMSRLHTARRALRQALGESL